MLYVRYLSNLRLVRLVLCFPLFFPLEDLHAEVESTGKVILSRKNYVHSITRSCIPVIVSIIVTKKNYILFTSLFASAHLSPFALRTKFH